ncbi:MAG TPA: hypothetical protein VH583_23795 [Vicinamibacterales bacterium]|jgi:hypothetical protein
MTSIRLAALLSAALMSGACFQMTTNVRVAADGSGTIDHTLLVTKAALAQLRNFSALGGGRQGKGMDLTSEDQAREMARTLGPGVTYVSSEPLDTPLGEGRHSTYSFSDISQVRISQQPKTDGLPVRPSVDPTGGDITCSMTHEANGNAVLHIKLPEMNMPAGIGDTSGNPALTQQLAMIRALLAGARISIGVDPTGTLVKTNSPFVEGSHVTLLEVNLDEVLGSETALNRLQAAKSPEELKAALADTPGLKIALEREVTIEFSPAR